MKLGAATINWIDDDWRKASSNSRKHPDDLHKSICAQQQPGSSCICSAAKHLRNAGVTPGFTVKNIQIKIYGWPGGKVKSNIKYLLQDSTRICLVQYAEASSQIHHSLLQPLILICSEMVSLYSKLFKCFGYYSRVRQRNYSQQEPRLDMVFNAGLLICRFDHQRVF